MVSCMKVTRLAAENSSSASKKRRQDESPKTHLKLNTTHQNVAHAFQEIKMKRI